MDEAAALQLIKQRRDDDIAEGANAQETVAGTNTRVTVASFMLIDVLDVRISCN